MKLQLELVTPEKKAFAGEADSVIIPAANGELGVLPGHVPLMTMLAPGLLRVTVGDRQEELAVGEGFVEITASRVMILTDIALTADQIGKDGVAAAISRAQAATRQKAAPEEAAALQAGIKKSLAQLNLKRRH